MARVRKTGLDYFPLDCTPDRKTKLLIRKYGLIGESIYITLLKWIYSEGYYIRVRKDSLEDFCIEFDLDDSLFKEILDFLVRKGFFSLELYQEDGILSSHGVQKVFLEATRKRVSNKEITEFELDECNEKVQTAGESTQGGVQSAGEIQSNSDLVRDNGVSSVQSTQSIAKHSIAKHSIAKHSIAKHSIAKPPAISPEDSNHNFREQVIGHLNKKVGVSFKAHSQKCKTHIHARINEGFGIEAFKAVIDIKSSQWLGDDKMTGYLRPETLFNSKFEAYLQEAARAPNTGGYETVAERIFKESQKSKKRELNEVSEQNGELCFD